MTRLLSRVSAAVIVGLACAALVLAFMQLPDMMPTIQSSVQVFQQPSCSDGDSARKEILRFASKKFYAVLAADTNPTYLFPLPIVVLSYNRLGVVPVVFLIGNATQYQAHPQRVVVDFLETAGARVLYIESNMTSTHMLAQTIRIFATGVREFPAPDNANVIMGDADMLIFSLVDRLPEPGQRVFVFASNCCGKQQLPGETSKYRHFNMQNMVMRTTVWREIMNITKDSISSGDDVVKHLTDFFGKELVQTEMGMHGSANWGLDQQLISFRINRWLNESKDHVAQFGEYGQSSRRIDRSRWNYDFKRLSVDDYHDSHILHPVHTEPNWGKTVPMLQQMFDESVMRLVKEYRDRFMNTSSTTPTPLPDSTTQKWASSSSSSSPSSSSTSFSSSLSSSSSSSPSPSSLSPTFSPSTTTSFSRFSSSNLVMGAGAPSEGGPRLSEHIDNLRPIPREGRPRERGLPPLRAG